MNKCVFLDRDGVINKEIAHYMWRIEDFIINIGIIDGLQLLQKNGFLLIIISNQGGISKGLYTHSDVMKLHQYLIDELKKNNIVLTDILYCPHHNTNELCLCRKPNTLLFEKAIYLYDIDVSESYMIGDNYRDSEAAKKVGIKPIQINHNENILPYCKAIIEQAI